jgi:hypothetical protein
VQCPFDGIRFSRDNSATWTAPRQNMSGPTDNLFGETCLNNTKVKFGAPHAVDFGQNNHFSPDGRLYIVGHGAESPESHQAWMQVRALCVRVRARAPQALAAVSLAALARLVESDVARAPRHAL